MFSLANDINPSGPQWCSAVLNVEVKMRSCGDWYFEVFNWLIINETSACQEMKWLRSPISIPACEQTRIFKLTRLFFLFFILYLFYSPNLLLLQLPLSHRIQTLMSEKISHMSLLRDREADSYAQHV